MFVECKEGRFEIDFGEWKIREGVFDTNLRKKYGMISFTTHRMQKEARVIFLSNRYVESFQFH